MRFSKPSKDCGHTSTLAILDIEQDSLTMVAHLRNDKLYDIMRSIPQWLFETEVHVTGTTVHYWKS